VSTRQSRFVLVDGSVHVHVRRDDLPADSDVEDDPANVNEWFSSYLRDKGAFVLEHESRHVHQLMAYPALYVRAVREATWARAFLADFRDRGDIDYDPTGQHRVVVDPSTPEVQFLIRKYQAIVAPYLAGTTSDGRLAWGDDPALKDVERSRSVSEATLMEAEALTVQYLVATKRGFDGEFRAWARARGTNPTSVNDLVTILCGAGERTLAERVLMTWLPALVWHAFHTTWPVTAYFNFLAALTAQAPYLDLARIDRDMRSPWSGPCGTSLSSSIGALSSRRTVSSVRRPKRCPSPSRLAVRRRHNDLAGPGRGSARLSPR